MRIGRLYADGDEYAQDFDVEDNDYMSHVVCEHYMGICLDEITEPDEHIPYIIEHGIVFGDETYEDYMAREITRWN